MEASQVVPNVSYVLGIVGVGGLVYWMRRWSIALEGALNAQKVTIDAQTTLMGNMASILNLADVPKMAERYASYKQLVDAEKDVYVKAAERKFVGRKKGLDGVEQ